jgi:hypothetical protein
MTDDREEAIRRAAYAKWGSERWPDGQHQRHWRESEAAMARPASSIPQTSEAGEGGHSGASDDAARGTETSPDQDGPVEDGEGSSPIEEPAAVPPGVVQRPKRQQIPLPQL